MAIVLDGSNQTTGGLLNSGTAQATTSGTAITFTGIPSTAKRITVMFNGVSTNGTSPVQVQLGSGSVTTSGYNGSATYQGGTNATQGGAGTTGLLVDPNITGSASNTRYGNMMINNLGSNTWVASVAVGRQDAYTHVGGGSVTLSGALDRVVLTTVNGTDTFDAGSVNIFWE
jgi:hypothetical protein